MIPKTEQTHLARSALQLPFPLFQHNFLLLYEVQLVLVRFAGQSDLFRVRVVEEVVAFELLLVERRVTPLRQFPEPRWQARVCVEPVRDILVDNYGPFLVGTEQDPLRRFVWILVR